MKRKVSDNFGFVLIGMAILLFCASGALASLGVVPWVASISFMVSAALVAGITIREMERPRFSSSDDFHV